MEHFNNIVKNTRKMTAGVTFLDFRRVLGTMDRRNMLEKLKKKCCSKNCGKNGLKIIKTYTAKEIYNIQQCKKKIILVYSK